MLSVDRRASIDWRTAVPALAIAIPALAGLGAAAVRILAGIDPADRGRLAAARTGVMAIAAVAAAALGARSRAGELAWLAYPLLALGGLKLLVEDVPNGRPLTLFIGFALYGATLLTVPRILRATG